MTEIAGLTLHMDTATLSAPVMTAEGKAVAVVIASTYAERKKGAPAPWTITRINGGLWPSGRPRFHCFVANPETAARIILRKIAQCLELEHALATSEPDTVQAPAEPVTAPAEPVRAFLVYQGGIANVFKVDCLNMAPYGRNAQRLMQSDFKTCVAFARGMAAAGANVATAFCNMAGDITDATWSDDVEQSPFRDSPHHVIVSTNLCLGV